MRVENTVQKFYRNVFNKKSNADHVNHAFSPVSTPDEPCKLSVKKTDKPLDVQAESYRVATENIGVRPRINVFTSDFEKLFGVGVNGEKEFNMESLGENKLTDDQIKDLQERYNVENLSAQEKYNLMAELTQLGVISGTDAVNSTLSMVAMPVVNGVPMMVKEGNGVLNSGTDFMSNLKNIAAHEMESYDYMKEMFDKVFDDVKNMSESHQRLYSVLEQLKREN